ncbi:hypothetical protein A7A78_09425 [Aequorivita soesokkakensis]|uniref:Lipoprotein n=1 Tax=Aequorivita soesokkakensis TaxID=1385699 RepID=A0A1A9LGX3_9FLAO|nr:hypothetical protein [Aequorivita soesokkakensis]OAD92136.1 hypothetical protein A7A78_09425 [Aequorivita soesokkakensis]
MIFKTKLLFPLLLLIFSISVSCDKEEDEISGCTDSLSYNYNPSAVSDNGTCEYYYGGREKGQIDVGAIVDLNNEYNIYIDGEYIGRLTYYFPNGLECGNPDAVGRIFDSGSHVIRAEGNGGSEIREGLVVLDPQECLVVLVENLPIIGNNKGDVKFWVNQDYGCGLITVNLNGVGSSTISGYYNGSPDCIVDGVGGNFNDLLPGIYNYSASCQGYNWNGSVTITQNGCFKLQLVL